MGASLYIAGFQTFGARSIDGRRPQALSLTLAGRHPPASGRTSQMMAEPSARLVSRGLTSPHETTARYGHVAAGVEGKVYVWGGFRRHGQVSHDGPDKAEIIFSVDVLDVKVRSYWGTVSVVLHMPSLMLSQE